jgi:NADH:ubiquinone oxidoreductase subunit 5 (subunit L)/multisubunit Na+/H+ antiporter MnhA subunit
MYAKKPVPSRAPGRGQPAHHGRAQEPVRRLLQRERAHAPGQYLTRALVFFDNRGIDGAVHGLAAAIGGGSGRLRRVQNGFVRSYALSIFGGAALVLAALLLVRARRMSDLPWLTVLGLVPLVGAARRGPARARRRARQADALLVSLVVLGLTIVMCAPFEPNGDRFQFVQAYDWIPAFGVQYAVGVDGIALVLIALVAVLVPVVVLSSWHDADPIPATAGTADGAPVPPRKRSPKTFFALLLVLETLMIGVFAAPTSSCSTSSSRRCSSRCTSSSGATAARGGPTPR